MDDDNERAERIAALERELAELRGGESRPLTLEEIRALTPEQASEHWGEVQKFLAGARDGASDVEPYGLERLRTARRKEGYPDA